MLVGDTLCHLSRLLILWALDAWSGGEHQQNNFLPSLKTIKVPEELRRWLGGSAGAEVRSDELTGISRLCDNNKPVQQQKKMERCSKKI